MLNLLELKRQMISSNSKSEETKTRDYKLYEARLFELLHRIGILFYTKSDPYLLRKQGVKTEQPPEQSIDVFGKFAPFLPKVNKDTVQILINIFSGVGVDQEEHDLLMIFRQFHTLKYH